MGLITTYALNKRIAMVLVVAGCLMAAVFGRVGNAYGVDYCVNLTPEECSGSPIGTPADSPAKKLQDALSAAEANAVSDQIFVGSGTYKTSLNSNDSFHYQSDDIVQIVGKATDALGINRPVIEVDSPNVTGMALGTAMTNVQAKISNVDFKLSADGANGLWLNDGFDADGVNVKYDASKVTSNSENVHGIVVGGSSWSSHITNSKVTLPGSQGIHDIKGIITCNSMVLSNSVISGGNYGVGDSFEGCANGKQIIIGQNKIINTGGLSYSGVSFISNPSNLKISDSLILPAADTGIKLSNSNGGQMSADIDRMTIVGTGSGSSVGVAASSEGSNGTATVNLTDSILDNLGTSIDRYSASGSTANVVVTSSFYDDSEISEENDGAGVIVKPLSVDYLIQDDGPDAFVPGFVDPANGDFHLKYNSPLIDTGTVDNGNCQLGSPVDLDGYCRLVNGDGKAGQAYDVGAYEYLRKNPVAKISASKTANVAIGEEVKFDSKGTEDKDVADKNNLTYLWTFTDDNGGPPAGGVNVTTVTHTFAKPGTYTAKLTVTDPAGLTGSATVDIEVVDPNAPDPDNPNKPDNPQDPSNPNNPNNPGPGSISTASDALPSSKISVPAKTARKAGKLKSLKGTAKDDKGLVRVDISLVRKAKKAGKTSCYALTSSGKFKTYKPKGKVCAAKFLLRAKGTKSWSVKLKRALAKGSYTVTSRATDTQQQQEGLTKSNRINFTIK